MFNFLDIMKIKMNILFLFLLLWTSHVQSTSFSFVDILSSIIANGRFVEENYINSNIPLEPFIPTIHTELFGNINTSNCSRDMQILSRDLINKQIWALKSN